MRDGRLTDEGLAALRSHMPYAGLADPEHDRRLNRIEDLFTAGLLANYIEWKLGRSREANGDADQPALAAPGLVLR
jgi:hypothetical protein